MRKLNENIDRLKTLMTLKEYSRVIDTYPNIKFLDKVVGSSTPSQDGINPALLNDIQKAAERAGVIVGITTAVSGHRSGQSRHPSGNAVDIAIIDDKAVSSSNREDADSLVRQLTSMGYSKNKEVGNPKAVLTFGFPGHDNHVHISNISGSYTELGSQGPENDEELSVNGNKNSSFTNSLSSKDNQKDENPLLRNILKSVGGIVGLASVSEIKKINNIYDSINETKINLNKHILKESKVFDSFGNYISYSYGDLYIPKNKNNSIKSPVDGNVEDITYDRTCSTDVIKISHEINDKIHYLTFCGVDPIKVRVGQSISKGTKLGEPKDDVKVTLQDLGGNKLPIKSYINVRNTKNGSDNTMNFEKEKSLEKRYSDPLLAGIITAPLKLLKGMKNKEGKHEKRWSSPTDPEQPSNWISRWSPSKKNPK